MLLKGNFGNNAPMQGLLCGNEDGVLCRAGELTMDELDLLRKYSSHRINQSCNQIYPYPEPFPPVAVRQRQDFEYLQFPVDVLDDGSEFA